MNEQNIPTAPEQSAPAAPETAAPRAPAEEAVTVGALRGAIERKAQQRARRAAEESAARWSREADELAAQCPDFDLGAALSDAQFCALLRAGVDVRTAWFALHAQALLEAAGCEKGEDDFLYPMPPEWLHAITTPPFYGCRIGGNLYGTKAGLLINDQMQVVGTNGLVIPGLYAGWHTAGGACGENSYIGDPILGSLMGDVGLAFCGGYLCGTSVIDNEF